MANSQQASPHSVKKDFLLFISIPAGLILLVFAFLFLPRLFANPKYSLIYSQCPSYSCANDFIVKDGTLLMTAGTSNGYAGVDYVGSRNNQQLYYYDVKTDSSRKIDLSEAQKYYLLEESVSPDGYTLEQNTNSSSGLLFWGYSGDYKWYLKNGLKKKQMNLYQDNVYGDNINFIGWVR